MERNVLPVLFFSYTPRLFRSLDRSMPESFGTLTFLLGGFSTSSRCPIELMTYLFPNSFDGAWRCKPANSNSFSFVSSGSAGMTEVP